MKPRQDEIVFQNNLQTLKDLRKQAALWTRLSLGRGTQVPRSFQFHRHWLSPMCSIDLLLFTGIWVQILEPSLMIDTLKAQALLPNYGNTTTPSTLLLPCLTTPSFLQESGTFSDNKECITFLAPLATDRKLLNSLTPPTGFLRLGPVLR